MKDGTSDELHIVMDHIPGDGIATGNPTVCIDGIVTVNAYKVVVNAEVAVKLGGSDCHGSILRESARCRFHNGEGLRKYTVKLLLNSLILLLHKLVRHGSQTLFL